MSLASARRSVIFAFGTRPEAIKLAPVITAMTHNPNLQPIVVVSGQHREMLDQVNRLFGVLPDADLDIISPNQTLTEITTRALAGFSDFLAGQGGDAVVVQGDTTTTFAAAFAAFCHRIPVVHVEAGLRSDNPYSPYPEEINRRLVTQLSTLHLAPTPLNRRNLMHDGVSDAAIRVTGNTVIDAFLDVVSRRLPVGEPVADQAISDGRRIVLVTAHRRESWGQRMMGIGRAVAEIARRVPDVLVVVPMHRNPVVREALIPSLATVPNVVITEPMDYAAFSALIAASTLILTDSGGIQEEAPSLGKPVLVLRDTTERPEAVRAGTVELIGTDEQVIVERALRLLTDKQAYKAMAHAVNPYGDGKAAPRSVAAIEALLGVGAALPDFAPLAG